MLLTLFSDLFALGMVTIALLTIAAYCGNQLSYCELAAHGRGQYLGLSFLGCLVAILTRQYWTALLSALSFGVNLLEILPLYRKQPHILSPELQPLRLLHLNVWNLNRNFAAVLSLFHTERPDIIVLQEVDRKWVQQLHELEDIFPYTFINPGSIFAGIAVYSRYPLQATQIHYFARPDVPSLAMDVALPNQTFHLVSIHTTSPHQGIKIRQSEFQALITHLKTQSKPVVLVGDLNVTNWSPYFQTLLRVANLQDSRIGFGILPTWPVLQAFNPLLPSLLPWLAIPIDHCLVSSTITIAQLRTGAAVGSDHLPLIVDFYPSPGE